MNTAVANNNGAPKRGLRDSQPLQAGSMNPLRMASSYRPRYRDRSAAPVWPNTRNHYRRRRAKQSYRNIQQQLKEPVHTKEVAKNNSTIVNQASMKNPNDVHAVPTRVSGRSSINKKHKGRSVVDNDLNNFVDATGLLEPHNATRKDMFVASGLSSSNFSYSTFSPQDMHQDPVIVNNILLESLRMVEYLQHHTAEKARPYIPSKSVALYLEQLQTQYPGVLSKGHVQEEESNGVRLDDVGVGESAATPMLYPEAWNATNLTTERDVNGYTREEWMEVAKGDV